MINHAMFQRNGRSGFVLKPLALRSSDKELLCKRTKHILDIKVSFSLSTTTFYSNSLLIGYLSTTASSLEGRIRSRDYWTIGYRPFRRSLNPRSGLDPLSLPTVSFR